MRTVPWLIAGFVLAAGLSTAQTIDRAEIQLQAAIHKETIEGDLKGAIEQYQKILTAGGLSRAAAAKALLHLGQCHEKLGSVEARKAYERLVMEFADQAEPARVARERLAALGAGAAAKTTEMTIRRVWAGPDALDVGGPSPDGRYLSFTDWGGPDLAIHDLLTGENRRITSKKPGEPYAYPDGSIFSRDGKRIAYRWWFETSCEIRTIAPDGSEVRVLYQAKQNCPSRLDWSPDGKHLLTSLGNRPVLIAVADGSIQDLAIESPGTMCFSPDGRYIAYEPPPAKGTSQRDVSVYEVATQRSFPLVRHPADDRLAAWAPDGRHVLFGSDRRGSRDAWLIAVSAGQPRGEPILVRQGVGDYRGAGFTRSGAFFFAGSKEGRDIFSTRLDIQTGKLLSAPAEAAGSYLGSNWGPDFSRDGKYLAYVSGEGGVAIQSLETAEKKLIKPGGEIRRAGRMYGLRWAPDGRSLVVPGADGQGREGLLRIDLPTGQATLLLDPAGAGLPPFDLSPDGSKVFYVSDPSGGWLYVWDSESGQERHVSSYLLWSFAVSPDGEQVAFFGSGGQAERGLFVMPSAGGTPRLLVGAQDRRGAVAWSPDGRQVVYAMRSADSAGGSPATLRNEFWRVPPQGGEPQRLGLTVDGMVMSLRVHPDGQRMVYGTLRSSPEVWLMENFLPAAEAR